MENKDKIYDELEGHPQRVTEKIRRKILLASGIFPGVLGKSNEGYLAQLTRTKAAIILEAEEETGRKLNWQKPKEGD